MEELFEKINELIKVLDETKLIKNYKKVKEETLANKELKKLIEKFEYTKDERIKYEIINNDLYKKYKHEETELNILILEINSKLKTITNKDKCDLWK